MDQPSEKNQFQSSHAALLLASYARWTGAELLPPEDPVERARRLWEAPFPVLSHGLGQEPIFSYGNRVALQLFAYDWDSFTHLPSRRSAEPINQEERARILEQVRREGFSRGYRGVRISSAGRRFTIQNAIVWNLVDAAGEYLGQAATFDRWTFLD